MLSLTEMLEREDRTQVSEAVLKVDGVESHELMDMQLAAFEWANQVSMEARH